MVNSAAVNIKVHISFQIMVLSGYRPRSGIAGSYGSSISRFILKTNLLKNKFTVTREEGERGRITCDIEMGTYTLLHKNR